MRDASRAVELILCDWSSLGCDVESELVNRFSFRFEVDEKQTSRFADEDGRTAYTRKQDSTLKSIQFFICEFDSIEPWDDPEEQFVGFLEECVTCLRQSIRSQRIQYLQEIPSDRCLQWWVDVDHSFGFAGSEHSVFLNVYESTHEVGGAIVIWLLFVPLRDLLQAGLSAALDQGEVVPPFTGMNESSGEAGKSDLCSSVVSGNSQTGVVDPVSPVKGDDTRSTATSEQVRGGTGCHPLSRLLGHRADRH